MYPFLLQKLIGINLTAVAFFIPSLTNPYRLKTTRRHAYMRLFTLCILKTYIYIYMYPKLPGEAWLSARLPMHACMHGLSVVLFRTVNYFYIIEVFIIVKLYMYI